MAYERRGFAGGATATVLNGGITASTTPIVISSGTGWPDGSGGRSFAIVIDRGLASEEKILCSARSGASLTPATRGYDSTSAQSHSNGATVEHILTSVDADEANAAAAGTLGQVTTKGDALLATGANTLVRAAAPSNNQVRIADSAQTNGWTNYAIPLGYLGSASASAAQASIGTSATDLTSLSVTFTALASRRIKVTAQVPFNNKVTASKVTLLLRESTTTLEAVRGALAAGADTDPQTFSLVYTASAITGAHTYKLSALCDAGTVDVSPNSGTPRLARLLVEDIGV